MNDPSRSPAPAIQDDEDDRTFREKAERVVALSKRALKHWKVSALLLVVGSGLALFFAMNSPRIYRSECKIEVKRSIATSDNANDEAPANAEKLATELKETLLTRKRLEPVIKQFNLFPAIVDGKGMNDAVEELRTHIGLRASSSSTFVLSYEDDNRERTRDVTQMLAETTMADYKKSTQSDAEAQADFYRERAEQADRDLDKANREFAVFLSSHSEFANSLGSGFGQNPLGPMMMPRPLTPGVPALPADPVLASLYRQKNRIEAESRLPQQGGTPPAVTPGNDSVATLTTARDEAAKNAAIAQSDLAQKMASGLTDQHPDLVQARQKAQTAAIALRSAEAQLKIAKSGVAPTPSAVAPTASVSPEVQKQLQDLQTQIAARQSELTKMGSAVPANSGAAIQASPVVQLELEWQRLLRNVTDARAHRDRILEDYKRTQKEADAKRKSAFTQILDPAQLPTHPFKGGRTKIAGVGLLVAFIMAFAYAFARVFMDDTIVDVEDIEALTDVPVLGAIPRLRPLPGEGSSRRSKEKD